jgi:cytochrome c oxidase subunit II
MKQVPIVSCLFFAGFMAGCTGVQSALDPRGPAAADLLHIILFFVFVCTSVFLLVMGALVWSLLRKPSRKDSEGAQERQISVVVTVAILSTAVIIVLLTVVSFTSDRFPEYKEASSAAILVRGEQWWWRFDYDGDDRSPGFQTANELHIPVGQDVRLRLQATDVIHSFWVPSLAGKQDLVPGRDNTITLHAERPGIYRGQCAEFCGLQHAHMALEVVAQEPAAYRQWLESQRPSAVVSQDAAVIAGRDVFMRKPCAACHTIRGTEAKGTSGPDLTHVASRRLLAAGVLQNSAGSLAAWIADPQTIKPGNNMPLVPMTSEELRQVTAFLETLR